MIGLRDGLICNCKALRALVINLWAISFVARTTSGHDDRDVRLGVCLVGHERTIFSPAVAAAYEESFERFAHLQTFAVLEQDGSKDPQESFRSDARESNSSDKNLQRMMGFQRYGVSEANSTLLFVSANNSFVAQFFKPGGHCNNGGSCSNMTFSAPKRTSGPACEDRQSVEEWSHMRENGVNWAEQMWKIHLCGQLVDAWEAKRGMKFDWLLKWRSDIMLLQPFLQLPIQPPQNQFVYVNTNTRDHFFLCPRHLCNRFFHDETHSNLNCSSGPTFGFSHNRKSLMGYMCPSIVITLEMMSAKYRPSGPSGCSSVSCSQINVAVAAHVDDNAALEAAVKSIVRNPPGNWSNPKTVRIHDQCDKPYT